MAFNGIYLKMHRYEPACNSERNKPSTDISVYYVLSSLGAGQGVPEEQARKEQWVCDLWKQARKTSGDEVDVPP